jgi:hypothetical protein
LHFALPLTDFKKKNSTCNIELLGATFPEADFNLFYTVFKIKHPQVAAMADTRSATEVLSRLIN